jgi:hypothetical protein
MEREANLSLPSSAWCLGTGTIAALSARVFHKPLLREGPRVGTAPSLPYNAFVGWHLLVT